MNAPRPAALFVRLASALLSAAVASPAAALEFMPFQEVQPGMRGVGRSVFTGTRIEEFQVEILGRLENIGPRQNLILARFSGGPLASTGVMAGMSGSPVYVDGKLIGATAYSWPFAREPVAGITPIHEMLRLLGRDHKPSLRAGIASGLELRGSALSPQMLSRALDAWGARLQSGLRRAGAGATEVPVLLSGFQPSTTAELAQLFHMLPLQGGGSGKRVDESPAPELAPGSPVGARLVGGDLEVTAVGTVTHRDGDHILAFGHPLLNLGPTAIPMTTARVEALLPSLATSFKFTSGGPVVGSILQDRLSGLYGRLGHKPRTIPARVEVTASGPRPVTYSLDLAEGPLLTPLLLHLSILNLLRVEGRDFGEVTVTIRPGSVIQIQGSEAIQLANLYSGSQSAFLASLTVAYIVYIVMNNEYRDAPVGAVNLLLEVTPGRRAVRLGRVWTERPVVAPGSALEVFVEVLPQRGRPRVETVTLEIPEEAREGRALLQVGDALALVRAEGSSTGAMPRDLDQLIWLINHLRSNDRVYVTLLQADSGVWAEGERLPNLPPTQSALIAPPQRGSNFLPIPVRGLAEESVRVSGAVEGYRLLYLEIRH
ncbi:MAG: hypothetical protein V3U98_01920 [Acidobacteriota bacterium]